MSRRMSIPVTADVLEEIAKSSPDLFIERSEDQQRCYLVTAGISYWCPSPSEVAY